MTKFDLKKHINVIKITVKRYPKSFWKYVNKRRNNNAIPNILTLDL